MSNGPQPPDLPVTATISVRVPVAPPVAFEVFTAEIDLWWRRGVKFRHAGAQPGRIVIEPGVGGRVYEAFGVPERRVELGEVTVWSPPDTLAFTWRNATFAPDEWTTVEVQFAPQSRGTLVTVRHRGWTLLRKDHPARHGQDDDALARDVGMWWSDQLSACREFCAARNPGGS